MKIKNKLAIAACLVLLTGCGAVSTEQALEQEEEKEKPDYERIPSLVPVADYTGEEYELRGADPDMEISAEMEAEIETAVKEFFIENYKTEVKMNRYFKGNGYVRAVVESVGDPLFYTEVNVGLEKDGDVVTGINGAGSREGAIEQAISTGLVVLSRSNQFEKLDQLLEEFEQEYPVQGLRDEIYQDVMGLNYSTPYYFLSNSDEQVDDMLFDYLEDPVLDIDEWQKKYSELSYDQTRFLIAINLYMEEEGVEPSEKIHAELVKLIEESAEIPRGGYVISLHDSNIIGKMASGAKENSIRAGDIKRIVKD